MAPGSARHTYASGDIGRIQREAVASVKEIQNNARTREEEARFRNWSTQPNVPRENRVPRRSEEPAPPPRPAPTPTSTPYSPTPEPRNPYRQGGGRKSAYQQARQYGPRQENEQYQTHHADNFGRRDSESRSPPPPPQPQPSARSKDTTLLQDILGGIGLDDDRILILGLILILINDKADTTLILALCYLLL